MPSPKALVKPDEEVAKESELHFFTKEALEAYYDEGAVLKAACGRVKASPPGKRVSVSQTELPLCPECFLFALARGV